MILNVYFNLNYSVILFFEAKQNPCLYETLCLIGTDDSALRIISQIQVLHGYWQGVSRTCLSSDRKDCLPVALTAAVITCIKEDKQGPGQHLGQPLITKLRETEDNQLKCKENDGKVRPVPCMLNQNSIVLHPGRNAPVVDAEESN